MGKFFIELRYPVVRKKTAEKVYTFFLTIEDGSVYGINNDEIETINNILSDTNWTLAIKDIKPQRNLIAELLKIVLK